MEYPPIICVKFHHFYDTTKDTDEFVKDGLVQTRIKQWKDIEEGTQIAIFTLNADDLD